MAPAKGLGRRGAERPAGPFTLAEIERARAFSAALVIRHGDRMLPYFERLDAEVEARRRQESVIDRVRAIAGAVPA